MSKIFFQLAVEFYQEMATLAETACREKEWCGSINNMAGSLQILLLFTVAALTAAAPTPHEVGSCLVLLVLYFFCGRIRNSEEE
jgi:hypothetical protein